jgi:hypothetical protein
MELRLRVTSSNAALADPHAPTRWIRGSFTLPAHASLGKRLREDGDAEHEAGASGRSVVGEVSAEDAGTADRVAPDAPPATGASTSSGTIRSRQQPPRTAAVELSSEALTALTALRKPLGDSTLSEDARSSRCANGMQVLLSFTDGASMRAACDAIDADGFTDEAILCACQAAAQPDVSGRAAACFIGAALRPRLAALTQPASRTLFAALLALMRAHARALLDELLLPTMWLHSGELSPGQVEVLSRLLKELPENLLAGALTAFLGGEAGVPTAWSEAQVALMQAALARRPTLDAACVGDFLMHADANVDALRKSLKFSSLVSTFVKTHGSMLRPHLPAVRRVAERLDTFMRKSTLAAIAKLEAEARHGD